MCLFETVREGPRGVYLFQTVREGTAGGVPVPDYASGDIDDHLARVPTHPGSMTRTSYSAPLPSPAGSSERRCVTRITWWCQARDAPSVKRRYSKPAGYAERPHAT